MLRYVLTTQHTTHEYLAFWRLAGDKQEIVP